MWVRHENDRVPDDLCNRTMDDFKGDWREERKVVYHPGCNVVIFSHGGTRSKCSASAWALCVVSDEEKLVPVVAAGEAIALENATIEL